MLADLRRKELAELIRKHALEIKPEGEFFVLKSGAKSRFYLDCRNLHLTPDGLITVAAHIRNILICNHESDFDAIGGPCVGADPIIGALLTLFSQELSVGFFTHSLTNLRGFLVRKEEKEHGKGGRIIGPLKKGDRCIIVEDVTTTGQSTMSAVQAVRDFGAEVVRIFSVVDRCNGATELFGSENIPFVPLTTINDVLEGTGIND